MEPLYRCVAGIDVHKKMLAVVVRAPQGEYVQRKFGTTKTEIGHLAAWLQDHQVSEVVMESTAQYWRPVWYGLEAHFKLHLTHPLKTRAPRGRKADFRDARRLADRWHSGDLEESFIPGAEQRSWRWLTRSRVHLKRTLGMIRNQVEGLLEQGGIKLSAVVSDLFGVSGWAMLERIAQHVRETKLGSLVAVTIYTSGSALSFFAQGNICMTALHAEGSLPPQTRTQIAELVEKLSRTYAQPEAPHVDH